MTFTDAIDIQLARMKARYARTPLPRFFAWWGGELMGLLPTRARTLLSERSEALLIEAQGNELVFWRQTGNTCAEAARIAIDAPPDEHKAVLARVREAVDDPNLRIYYCIRAGRALRRSLTLPLAAESNLRQVLAFEMDRQTPFKADQVYFDYRVDRTDGAARMLQVELIAVPRAQLDAELAPLNADGVALDGVDCWREGSGSGRIGVNLLPADRRVRRRNMRLRLNLALGAAAIVLFVTAMLLSLSNREAALAAMTDDVQKAQNDAKQVTLLRKTLQDTIASANFLSRKKAETPVMTKLLADLTQRLPDDTYIERITVDEKDKVQLFGLSDDYSKLIEYLQKSELLENPTFEGSVQPDPRTKKNRFTLSVEFRKKPGAKETKDGKGSGHKTGGGNGNAPATNPE
ncbi:MAG TPA: PilN domain-containing protein [Rudaea sp.]